MSEYKELSRAILMWKDGQWIRINLIENVLGGTIFGNRIISGIQNPGLCIEAMFELSAEVGRFSGFIPIDHFLGNVPGQLLKVLFVGIEFVANPFEQH